MIVTRFPNRKLYLRDDSITINLTEVYDLIADGEDIILDDQTKKYSNNEHALKCLLLDALFKKEKDKQTPIPFEKCKKMFDLGLIEYTKNL